MMTTRSITDKAMPVLYALAFIGVCISPYTVLKTKSLTPVTVEQAGPDTVRPEPRPRLTSIRPKPAPAAIRRNSSLK